jgi:hypothetical protein
MSVDQTKKIDFLWHDERQGRVVLSIIRLPKSDRTTS